MNIEKRKSRDGKKIHYLIAWGRGTGQRVATGIFTFANPENLEQKRYNKEALILLEQKRAQMVLNQQSVGTGYIPAHKFKANFLDYMEDYIKTNARIGNRHLSCCFDHFKNFLGKPRLCLEWISFDCKKSWAYFLFKSRKLYL